MRILSGVLLLLLLSAAPARAEVYCLGIAYNEEMEQYYPAVPCGDPSTFVCGFTGGSNPHPECAGFNHYDPMWDGWCLNPQCDMTLAQVPELEEYAAALFLLLALWIGWRARRNTVAV